MSINLPIVSKFDATGLRKAQDGLRGLGETSKNIATGAAKAFGAAGLAAGAAATGLIVSSVKAFSELEQNIGGSEAVFGDYALDLQDTASAAFKNLGISTSDYLATANKMGSLFQGSGIAQADALLMTEEAMQRAADMASVMGIDMSMAMEAVTGAAKGNFTMMDNLGVAMNATNIEAYALSKGMTDFRFATATSAEKAEMAMQMFLENTEQYAGNFAREATETISGSIGMLQASTSTLVAGLGDANADVAELSGNVVEAFEAVVKNVVPIIENIAEVLPVALSTMVEASGPIIQSLTEIIVGLIPTIIDAGLQLMEALLRGIMDALPQLISMLPQVLVSITQAIIDLLPMLIDAGAKAIYELSFGIQSTLPTLIPVLIDGLLTAVDALIEALPYVLAAGVTILNALVEGLFKAMPDLMNALPEIIEAITDFLIGSLPHIISLGLQLFLSLVEALPEIINGIVGVIPQIIDSVVEVVLAALPQLIDAGIQLFLALVGALPEIIEGIVAVIPEIITAIVSAIIESVPALIDAGKELIKGIWQGMNDMAGWLRGKISGFFGGVVDDIRDFFGIRSPSKMFAEIGQNLGQGMAQGIVASTKDVERAMGGMMGASSVALPGMSSTMAMTPMGVGAMSSGGARASVAGRNTYNITVNAGMGTNGSQVGEQIVNAIKRYERNSGPVFARA